MSRSSLAALIVMTTVVTSLACAQDAEFYALGDVPGGDFDSRANAVSDDGRKVAGMGSDANFDSLTGFIWSSESGLEPLKNFGGLGVSRNPQVLSMSSNGQFVVGRIRDSQSEMNTAYRWTEANGYLEIQSPEEYTRNSAWGVSADGSVVVGDITTSDFETSHAFRWTQQSGMTDLGLLNDGDLFSYGYGVSEDGQVVVGASGPPRDVGEAFRWTESEGMVGLGFLEGGISSRADDVSSDGSIVVGSSRSGMGENRWEAFRWKDGEGMSTLGPYPPEIITSNAAAVSAGGQVIVGSWGVANSESIVGYDSHAMVWTESAGPQQLRKTLIDGGAGGLENWVLETTTDVSGNGQWIVGVGINPDGNDEAFLARLSSHLVPGFQINPGLNDAWFNSLTNGQGMLIAVFPDIKQMFLAWFTYDTERPPEDVGAILGEPGHRWLTAQGPYSGDTAELTIYMTEGGIFDSGTPVPATDPAGDGTMTLEFADCSSGLVTYEITSTSVSGKIPIERITNDNVALCEVLSNE